MEVVRGVRRINEGDNKMKSKSLPGWAHALLGVVALLFATLWSAQAAAQSPGPEVCKGCHEAYVEGIALTKHGAKGHPKSPAGAGQDCAACHGDATEHVKAGGGKGVGNLKNPNSKNLSADQKSAICLTCHGGDKHLAFWDSGRHRKNEVSCNNCHSVHQINVNKNFAQIKKGESIPTPLRTTDRQLQFETCVGCHKQVRAQIGKPSHHPIIEGKVTCSDCHNPHGALSHAMVKNESVNDLCTTCHADKRGPWLFEHPPVEENCLNCHNSHGSIHNRLLNEKVPNLCQDCHDWSRHPGTAYGGNQGFPPGLANTRFLARACVNCHQAIHGSTAPATKGQFFLR